MTTVLDYGRAAPARWRRLIRWTIVALLLVTLALVGLFAIRSLSLWLARRDGYAKVTAWYQQARTCMIPAGTLLYSERPEDLRGFARRAVFDQPWPLLRSIGFVEGGVPTVSAYNVLYVHEHPSWIVPRGSRPMLFCVSYIGLDPAGRPEFLAQSFDLAEPMPHFQIASSGASTSVRTPITRSLINLRIFAGAPNATDPTRFALPFTCDGGAGRFEFQTDVDVTDGGQLAPSATIAWDDAATTTQAATRPS